MGQSGNGIPRNWGWRVGAKVPVESRGQRRVAGRHPLRLALDFVRGARRCFTVTPACSDHVRRPAARYPGRSLASGV
eukprot:4110156-Prymnesium_polylepis.1